MEIKIQKILSDYGICSRRAGEELIQQGNVTVNGSIAMIGQRADPEKDIICVDGKTLSSKPEDTYILLNKPKGYVVTLNDEKGRRNVTDLLQELSVRVYPVGRLDINSEGLLILTNDGQFSNMLMHPSKEIEKEYYVWVRGKKLDKSIERLSLPMTIDNYSIKPAKVRVIEQDENGAQLSVIIHEAETYQRRLTDTGPTGHRTMAVSVTKGSGKTAQRSRDSIFKMKEILHFTLMFCKYLFIINTSF